MWTIQPYTVYLQLRQTVIFHCDARKVINLSDDENFKAAYQWMIKLIGLVSEQKLSACTVRW